MAAAATLELKALLVGDGIVQQEEIVAVEADKSAAMALFTVAGRFGIAPHKADLFKAESADKLGTKVVITKAEMKSSIKDVLAGCTVVVCEKKAVVIEAAPSAAQPAMACRPPPARGGPDQSAQYIPENATCLADFGYEYDDALVLRNIEDGGNFKFLGQAHYNALGDMCEMRIQEMMVKDKHMAPVSLPVDASADEPQSVIFHSDDFFSNSKRLLVIIQGSGAVRAGQWARSLCINDSLQTGTVLPYIDRAYARGCAVIVLNPNLNSAMLPDGRRVKIRENGSAEQHTMYVYEKFIKKCPAVDIAIVAHSYGGVSTTHLLRHRGSELLQRLRSVAFTDTLSSFSHAISDRDTMNFIRTKTRNWVGSDEPLDSPVDGSRMRAEHDLVSAGHPKHEYTSGYAMESVFEYLDKYWTVED